MFAYPPKGGKTMNPMKWHPMKMDPMIFELNAGVHATSLYLIICAYQDEDEKPTLNNVMNAWNGTEEELVRAVGELNELRVLKPMEPLQYDRELLLNIREDWAWCKMARTNGCLKMAI